MPMINRERFLALLTESGVTQVKSAGLIAEQTQRPCSARTVRSWAQESSCLNRHKCPLSRIVNREISVRPSMALDAHRAEIRRIVEANMATNPRVFGSVVRGEDKDGSDIDILVDALPGETLFDLGGIQYELQQLLGVRVDLLTPRDISVKFRADVLAEAVPV
ncbi:hypothetical protein SBC1_27260 [Caballeronia sp. SBC1]|nr:hypothetical protein SBC1_27260 [Caballeronia sp. SBC1]